MLRRLVVAAGVVALPFGLVVTGHSAAPFAQPPAQDAARPPAAAVSPQRALLNQYCVGCHNTRARAAGQEAARKLTLDDVDVNRVADHPEIWETVVRKLRAGMMPPANSRRPDKATYSGFMT